MRLLLLAAAAALLSVAYGVMPCPTCGEFCSCVNRLAPSNLVPTSRLNAAYTKCDDGEFYDGTDSEDAKWTTYERCLMPPCPACSRTIETIYEMDPAKRKKRSAARKKRQTDPEWDQWETCMAQALGMTKDAYSRYEEQLALAESGVEVCYLLSCGQTYEQMSRNDKACMQQAGITSAELYAEFED